MKRIFLAAGLMLLPILSYAQDENILKQVEEEPASYEVYCELVSSVNGIFTNKVTVDIDFGQFTPFWSIDSRLVDELGNQIVFNSMLDAANYMAKRGWVFKQAYVTQTFTKGDSSSPRNHWIMAKQVTSDEQITEGLITSGMTKRR